MSKNQSEVMKNIVNELKTKINDAEALKANLWEKSNLVNTTYAVLEANVYDMEKGMEALAQKDINLYNKFAQLASELYELPIVADGRWVSYEESYANCKAVYLFNELLGELNHEMSS